MNLSKYRLKFPLLKPEECRFEKMEYVLEEIKFSKNCLVIYEPHSGPVELLFTGLDEDMLASCIVLMAHHRQLYQFLKMAIIAVDRMDKPGKGSMKFYDEVVKFIKENFNDIVPESAT